jgi:hypothetical protein
MNDKKVTFLCRFTVAIIGYYVCPGNRAIKMRWDISMDALIEYRQQAWECREMAGKATSFALKRQLLQIAETWEMLARQREAYLALENTYSAVRNANAA